MADKCHINLLGLIILHSLITGTSEEKDVHVFGSCGENIILSCNKTHSNCTLATWIYYRESNLMAVTLFNKGIKMNGNERLSLGSDRSLNIYNATEEDYGFYICRQNLNEKYTYTDANVYLHFLYVSSSATQTEIRPGIAVTLSCHFYSFDDALCKSLFIIEGFQLVWVNEAGVNLNPDSRFHISYSSNYCNSTLTTTLLNKDNNRECRCQLIKGTEVKTSASYTFKYLGSTLTQDAQPLLGGSFLRVILIIIEFAVVTAPTVTLLWIICKRRTDNRRAQNRIIDSQFQMSEFSNCNFNRGGMRSEEAS